MGYIENMTLAESENFRKMILNAMCKCAIDLASSPDMSMKTLAGRVANNPRMFQEPFCLVAASLGSLTENSNDQDYYAAISSIWPLMSIGHGMGV